MNKIIGRPPKANIDKVIAEAFPCQTPEVLANNFSDQFSGALQKLHQNTLQPVSVLKSSSCCNSAYLPMATEFDLWQAMRSMPITKSPGLDGIRLRDLVCNFSHIKLVLLYIINETFRTGRIPEGMKITVIRPLLKKASRKNFANYRPIAILNSLACVLEKIVYNNMNSFCQKYDLFSSHQFGFRSGLSTIHLLEEFNDRLCSEIDKNNLVITLFIDLQKAFDTIDHCILLNKLNDFGFRGPYLAFFKDYFSKRFQRVRVGDCYSKPVLMKTGLPQGSILGPLLFNIYVNDLASLSLESHVYMYADDTAVVFP